MTFVRDRNAHTRGIGAIAAGDRDPMQQRRRLVKSRIFQRRDAAVGRLAGLGAMNLSASVPTQLTSGITSPGPGPQPVGPLTPAQQIYALSAATRAGSPAMISTSVPISTGLPTVIVDPSGNVVSSPVQTVTGTSTTSPVGTMTSGSGTVSSPVPVIAAPAATPIPDAPTVPVATSDDNTTTYLLIGAAALGAYLLFFRKSA